METVWISMLGAFLALDTSLAFQFLISQPLIACTILGWFLGDVQSGLHFGFLMQMIWLGNMPVGASSVPEGNLASMSGVPVYLVLMHEFPLQSHLSLVLVIFYVLLLSALGLRLVAWIRMKSVVFIDLAMLLCARGRLYGVSVITFLSLVMNMLLFALFIGVAVIVGQFLGRQLLALFPVSWDHYAVYTEMAIIGVGIGTVLPLYKSKRSRYMLIAGAMAGILIFYIL